MFLALVWIGTGNITPAYAQDDPEAAKAHYSKATRLYQVGDYRQALEEFKAAHLAKPDAAFLYNIAQCHRQLGEIEQAVTMYKRFLAISPNAANHAEVENRIAEMQAELSAQKRKATVGAPPASSPGQPAASAPASSPPASVVRAPGVPVSAAAPPLPTAPPAIAPGPAGTAVQPAAVTLVAEPERPGSSLRYLRWIGAGVTLALAGGAIISGLSASSKYDDLKNTCGKTAAGCSESSISDVKSRVLVTNLLWGAAGVAAVGTGVIFYLTPRQSGVQVAWGF